MRENWMFTQFFGIQKLEKVQSTEMNIYSFPSVISLLLLWSKANSFWCVVNCPKYHSCVATVRNPFITNPTQQNGEMYTIQSLPGFVVYLLTPSPPQKKLAAWVMPRGAWLSDFYRYGSTLKGRKNFFVQIAAIFTTTSICGSLGPLTHCGHSFEWVNLHIRGLRAQNLGFRDSRGAFFPVGLHPGKLTTETLAAHCMKQRTT